MVVTSLHYYCSTACHWSQWTMAAIRQSQLHVHVLCTALLSQSDGHHANNNSVMCSNLKTSITH